MPQCFFLTNMFYQVSYILSKIKSTAGTSKTIVVTITDAPRFINLNWSINIRKYLLVCVCVLE
jgi:hypothetical protein